MSLRYREAAMAAGWVPGDDPREFVDPAEFTQVVCGEVVTKQSFRDEVDINRIVQRFDKDGVLTHLNEKVGTFADVSAIGDYRTAIEQIRRADAFFMQLPASVREKYANDPASFLDALVDPSRKPELEELGVLKKEPPPVVPAAAPAQ